LATAASKRRELRVRLARLRAELGGKDAIELERIPGEADYPPELIRQERSILQARLSALQNQVAGLRRQIELSTEEVWSLKARLESSAKQQISVAKELSSLKGLSEKGILLAPRQTTLERLSAQIEGDQRDIDARIAQVRQTMAQAEASISRLIDERNREVGLELRSTSGQLEELDQHIALHRSLIAEAEALGGLTRLFEGGTRAVRLEYRVTRVEPDGPREFPAQGNDPVEPGDLITVDQFIGDGTLASESASSAPVGGIARRTQ
jgi:chromosome segregation ATPase